MPQFSPGQSKKAIVPATVIPSGLSCQLEVFLGPNESTKVATSGLKAFTSTGGQQSIAAPVVMPAAAGTYHVYIDLYAAGYYLAGYQATEDVVIAAPLAGEIFRSLIWYEPLTAWEELVPGQEIPLGGAIYISPVAINRSTVNAVLHVDMKVTYPSGTQKTLAATANQDREWAPGNGTAVLFEPFNASQEGTYTVVATLSSSGQVLDSVTFTLVVVITAPAFVFSNPWVELFGCPTATAWGAINYECTIANNNPAPVTHTLKFVDHAWSHTYSKWAWSQVYRTFNLTLQPGQSIRWRYNGFDGTRCIPQIPKHYTIYYWLEDETGNKSNEVSVYNP